MVVARSEDKLNKVVKKCLELGAKSAHYVKADLSKDDVDYYQRVIDESVTHLGGLDTLVLNHVTAEGVLNPNGNYKELDMEVVKSRFNVNAFSYFALFYAATDALEKS